MTESLRIWDGIFPGFAEVAGDDDVFNSEHWLDRLAAPAREAGEKLAKGGFLTGCATTRDYILPVVAAMAAEALAPDQRLSILDIGGGMAATYFPVADALPGGSQRLDFHVVENKSLCARARAELGELPGLTFHATRPLRPFHMVQVASCLHYIEDWRGALAEFCRIGAEHLILSDLPAGDIPTFATAQLYFGSRIPVWKWAMTDILEAMAAEGYHLVYKSLFIGSFRGTLAAKPMSNFPSSHRLAHNCQLVFRRS